MKKPMLAGTDRDWEEWARRDPYWAVLSVPKFRRNALDDSALSEFFLSGREHVAHVLMVLRQNFRSDFKPLHSLDFGCGVGRLVIPLARCSNFVTGVDVSPTMLAEAKRNAELQNAANVRFLQTNDLDSVAFESVDMIHSFIVFQHIPPSRGEVILKKLLGKLKPGGLGALHLTVARNAPLAKRVIASVRRHSNIVNRACNLLQGRPVSGPAIHMYTYSLSNIVSFLGAAGCGKIFAEFLEHRDYLGVIFYFEKTQPLTMMVAGSA